MKKDKIGNPIKEDKGNGVVAVKIGYYRGNTIYDKGENSDKTFVFRYYARRKPYKGFDRGPITANGNDLRTIRAEIRANELNKN